LNAVVVNTKTIITVTFTLFGDIWHYLQNVSILQLIKLQHATSDVEKMVLGNKCDMNDRRQVSRDRGAAVCSQALFLVVPLIAADSNVALGASSNLVATRFRLRYAASRYNFLLDNNLH